MCIQDILDNDIELYGAIMRIWDADKQTYIDTGRWEENRMKQYRYLPITHVYVANGVVYFEVKKGDK